MIMWGLPEKAREDCFRPPDEPCLVRCLHCGHEYTSDRIVWREEDDGEGFWCCPEEGCDGRGYTFDIHPIDGPGGEFVGWVEDECDGDCEACEDPCPDEEDDGLLGDDELSEDDDPFDDENFEPGEDVPW
ncbi:MAG TPA: hypothetical protein VM695_14760 [Phycisphaerae bacterium]|nr:hypothetical protein [Phycisphaerae bacterium]